MEVANAVDQQAFLGFSCPACLKAIVVCATGRNILPTEKWEGALIFPKNRALRPVPPEIPPEYANDFIEACVVIDLSPKSSAALSRRLLQRVLHVHFRI